MNTIIKNFMLSVLGGIMISLGGVAFLSIDNKYLGALLFSIGLFTICHYALNLFTGKIGYLLFQKIDYWFFIITVWLGNLLGTQITSLMVQVMKPQLVEKALVLADKKLLQAPLQILFSGFFCGLLMFIAVDSFKSGKDVFSKYVGIFLCVPVFILSGLEHCIADMFYFQLAGSYSLQSLSLILIASLGNVFGSLLIPVFTQVISPEIALPKLKVEKALLNHDHDNKYRNQNLYRREQPQQKTS
ncbi:MAG: formate/nitrite transporter family protein [Clostridia bacterium]